MKRKWAWLALPMLLGVLLLGVKWRAEHPTPTKEDLKLRVLLRSSQMEVTYRPLTLQTTDIYDVKLSKQDSEALVEDFFLLPLSSQNQVVNMTSKGTLSIYCGVADLDLNAVFINLDIVGRRGSVEIMNASRDDYRLHPATAKRWIAFLLAHPRLGPKLKADMK